MSTTTPGADAPVSTPPTDPPVSRSSRSAGTARRSHAQTVRGLLIKIVLLGVVDAIALFAMFVLVMQESWLVFGIAAVVAGLAGVMYTPLLPPNYHLGMDFLVLSFVVVVVGGMGSLAGAVAAGFLLGILQSFASMTEVKSLLPGIDQIIIYLVAVTILLVRPRGLMGRRGVMES